MENWRAIEVKTRSEKKKVREMKTISKRETPNSLCTKFLVNSQVLSQDSLVVSGSEEIP